MVSLIRDFEANFPQKVGLKILNSGMILKMFTHVFAIWATKVHKQTREANLVSLIQDFEADFPQKVGLKILNSGMILKTFTQVHK